jgi:membrane protease YdiL (CAAX protease family)
MSAQPVDEAPGGPAPSPRSGVWLVLAAYVAAFVSLIALNLVALIVLRDLYPDVGESDIARSLPGLLAGGLASSTALMLTLLFVVRPVAPERLRLRPGRETAWTLGLMVVGTLAVGQMLDAVTWLLGLANHGSMALIRRALEGAAGPDLFAAVLVIGPIAGAAEEVFFRGYVQTTLTRAWRPSVAVVVTAAAFGLMHFDWVHSPLAFGLGLWLGAITERADSALPALVAHVVNNTIFTVLTAFGATVEGVAPNVAVGAVAAAVFAGCVLALRRRG